jgi:hypothetical protein
MADPAPVLRREVDALIQTQITILNQAGPLTEWEVADFRARSEKIRALFKAMDLSKPLPEEPVRERKFTYPYPSV